MEKIRDIVLYIFKNYPKPEELSKPRFVKMIYLADWKSCLLYGEQITSIEWFYNHYGPYVNEIVDSLRGDSDFEIISKGDSRETVRPAKGAKYSQELSRKSKEVLDFVVLKTSPLEWDEFYQLVYSTYPIVIGQKYSKLDLVSLSKEYKENKLLKSI